MRLIPYLSLVIVVSGCSDNIKPLSVVNSPKQPSSPQESKESARPHPRDRVVIGLGYNAMRGGNLYGSYNAHFFGNSAATVNASLALSDKSISGQHLFELSESPFSVGYSASFRDYKIVPSDSSTKNMQFSFTGIGAIELTSKSSLVSTFGVEYIQSKTGMAGVTGSQIMTPFSLTYRLDERVHPQIPMGFGYFLSSNIEVSGVGEQYIKGSVRGQIDVPLSEFVPELALSFKAYAGSETSLNNRAVPVVKRLFVENGSPVRGYAANAFGYNKNGVPIGGSSMVTGSAELWSPLLHDDLRAFVFADAGVMRGNGIASSDIKTSVGAGVMWNSPVGVVSLSYGKALNSDAQKQVLGINFGINY